MKKGVCICIPPHRFNTFQNHIHWNYSCRSFGVRLHQLCTYRNSIFLHLSLQNRSRLDLLDLNPLWMSVFKSCHTFYIGFKSAINNEYTLKCVYIKIIPFAICSGRMLIFPMLEDQHFKTSLKRCFLFNTREPTLWKQKIFFVFFKQTIITTPLTCPKVSNLPNMANYENKSSTYWQTVKHFAIFRQFTTHWSVSLTPKLHTVKR